MRQPSPGAQPGHQMHYGRLLVMAVLSFASMYALMYAMVNGFANVYMNLNQVYMAGLMAAPMVIIELALMGAMYRCEEASIRDPEIKNLCGAIVSSQQSEIDQMKSILAKLER